MVNQIIARLGLDTTRFRAGVARAERSVSRLSRAVRAIGVGSSIAGLAAISASFLAIIRHSRDLDGELTKNQASAKQFAEAFDGIKTAALEKGVDLLGRWNSLMQSGFDSMERIIRGEEEWNKILREREAAQRASQQIESSVEFLKQRTDILSEQERIRENIRKQQLAEMSASDRLITLEQQLYDLRKQQASETDRIKQLQIENQILALEGIDIARARKAVEDEAARSRADIAQQYQSIEDAINKTLRDRQEYADSLLSLNDQLLRKSNDLAKVQEEMASIDQSSLDGRRRYSVLLDKELSLERDLNQIKKERLDLDMRIAEAKGNQVKAAAALAKSEDDLASAAYKRTQFSLDQAAAGETGSSSDQRRAQQIQREIDRQRRIARHFERAQAQGADQFTLDQIRGQAQSSLRREAELRRGFGPGLRPEDRDPFASEREAVELSRKQLDELVKVVTELKALGNEPIK